jgi:uncharacterized RDD family membrane protein YckC
MVVFAVGYGVFVINCNKFAIWNITEQVCIWQLVAFAVAYGLFAIKCVKFAFCIHS